MSLRAYTKALAVLLLGYASTCAAVSYNDRVSEIGCTTGRLENRIIDGIAYRNTEPVPMIHIKGGRWAYLSWAQQLGSDRGRTLLVLALTAYEAGAKVDLECRDYNDIGAIWIRDF